MSTRKFLAMLFVIVSCYPISSSVAGQKDDLKIQRAKEVFQEYVRLELEFSPRVADLYSDDAMIRNRRTYPSGQVRELTLPAQKYKDLIRTAMPLAKMKNDTNSYTKIVYMSEGEGVRIAVDRFSNLKQYHSPLSILVKKSPTGHWLIYEELSESQP